MLENPRNANTNLATILTWNRSVSSPDTNPYKTPQECVIDLLEQKLSPIALLDLFLNDKHLLTLFRITSTPNGHIRVQTRRNRDASWIDEIEWTAATRDERINTIDEYADEIFELVAEQPDALTIVKKYYALRPVYILGHGSIRYQTHAFGDSWDSGMCGIAYIDPSDENLTTHHIDELCAIIDEEVAEYDAWANGEYDETLDWFDETNLRCPSCGHTANFVASAITLQGPVAISPDGWDWSQAHSADFCEHTQIACDACGHTAPVSDFQPNE